MDDFREWKRNRKPTNVTITTPTLPPAVGTVTAVQTKQQKIDDNMLMDWKQTRKENKVYPV